MGNKFLIYTSNLGFIPKNVSDVVKFAKENNKFYIANVELNRYLTSVKAGDNIITKKGNSLYIIKTIDRSIDDLPQEDREYVDDLQRNYGLKKVNITSVASRVKYEDWCKQAIQVKNNPIINKTTKGETTMKNSSIKGFFGRLKDTLMPKEIAGVRVAHDGNICVETDCGYVAISGDNQLISYPKEFTFNYPVYSICKPKSKIAVGDVIAFDNGKFAKIVKIDDNKLTSISYTGSGKTIHLVKDFMLNESFVRVVVSLVGTIDNQINPFLLAALGGDEEDGGKNKLKNLLPLMLLNQSNGQINSGLAMLAFAGDDDEGGNNDLFKNMIMMQAFGGGGFGAAGGNLFGNLFGGCNCNNNAKAAAPEAVKEPVPEAKDEEKAE